MADPHQHELKCWPKFYEHIQSGAKNFEIRKNDRGFQVGDILCLREWEPVMETYTGRECRREISYTTDYAQADGHIVMGLQMPKSAVSATGTPERDYAKALAVLLHKRYYSDVKDWKPLDSTIGILTQIDNMISGMPFAAPPPVASAPEERLPSALFDGHAVYRELRSREATGLSISAEAVVEVLDAVVRLARLDMNKLPLSKG